MPVTKSEHTQAIAHWKATTINDHFFPSSLLIEAIAAIHGVYSRQNTNNENAANGEIMVVISAISFLRSAVYLGLDVGSNTFGIVLVGVVMSIFQVAIAYFESLILCCIASMTINTEYIADQMESIDSKPNKQSVDDYLKTIKPL